MNYSFPSTIGTARVVTSQKGFTFTIYAIVAAVILTVIGGLVFERFRLSKELESKTTTIANIKKELDDAMAMVVSIEKENTKLREQMTLIQDTNQVKEVIVQERFVERKETQSVKTRVVHKLQQIAPPMTVVSSVQSQERSAARIDSLWELYLAYEGEKDEKGTSTTTVPNSMPNNPDGTDKRSNDRSYLDSTSVARTMCHTDSSSEAGISSYDYGSERGCVDSVQHLHDGNFETVRSRQTVYNEDSYSYSRNDQQLQYETEV